MWPGLPGGVNRRYYVSWELWLLWLQNLSLFSVTGYLLVVVDSPRTLLQGFSLRAHLWKPLAFGKAFGPPFPKCTSFWQADIYLKEFQGIKNASLCASSWDLGHCNHFCPVSYNLRVYLWLPFWASLAQLRWYKSCTICWSILSKYLHQFQS